MPKCATHSITTTWPTSISSLIYNLKDFSEQVKANVLKIFLSLFLHTVLAGLVFKLLLENSVAIKRH